MSAGPCPPCHSPPPKPPALGRATAAGVCPPPLGCPGGVRGGLGGLEEPGLTKMESEGVWGSAGAGAPENAVCCSGCVTTEPSAEVQ